MQTNQQDPEIQLPLQSVNDLWLSPAAPEFCKHRLNNATEEYIVEEARAAKQNDKLRIVISIPASELHHDNEMEKAIRQHFRYRTEQSKRKLNRTLQLGWRSLIIGFIFLVAILLLTQFGSTYLFKGNLGLIIRESLIILGWVALWRPADYLLYEWYPIRREMKLFEKLAVTDISVIQRG